MSSRPIPSDNRHSPLRGEFFFSDLKSYRDC
nr:MAG TPA: hypothetical protein [Bacteriophage sp.]